MIDSESYTQKEGIDYEKTFSLVIRFILICLILAMVAQMDLELYRMDIKMAFLNEELDKKSIWNNL